MPHSVDDIREYFALVIVQEGLPLARRAWHIAEADARRRVVAQKREPQSDTDEFRPPLTLTPLDEFPPAH